MKRTLPERAKHVAERTPGGRRLGTRRGEKPGPSATSANPMHSASHRGHPIRIRRPRPNVFVAFILGLLAGTAWLIAGGFDYRYSAVVRISGDAADGERDSVRNHLLGFLWETQRADGALAKNHTSITVQAEGSDALRIDWITRDRGNGLQQLRTAIQRFLRDYEARKVEARETPDPAETALADHVAALQTRIAALLSDAQLAADTAFDDDPAQRHTDLQKQWHQLRNEVAATRLRLSEAEARVAQMRDAPPPKYAVVSGESRRRAHEADDVLRHDLRELAVNLAEVKRFVLAVWHDAGAPLTKLKSRIDDLIERINGSEPSSGTPSAPADPAPLAAEAAAFRELVAAFEKPWNREAAALRVLESDPYSREILERYQRMRRILHDFLFDAGLRLTAVRSAVRGLGADSSATARHHVYHSELTRAFQALQTAHHRFEQASGGLDTSVNFRLDAAYKAARGLQNRTQTRIHQIEEKLREEAVRLAREQQAQELTDAVAELDDIRARTDGLLDELLAVQDLLNRTAERALERAGAATRAAVAAERLHVTKTHWTDADLLLREASATRLADLDRVQVEVAGYSATASPVNLQGRLATAGIAVLLTFMTVLFAQWWIIRRPS